MAEKKTNPEVTKAVAAEREAIAAFVEKWGNAPPNKFGRRALLAAAIRRQEYKLVIEE